MNKLGVKGRAFMLAFIPMLFITSVLSVYFISSQLSDIDREINDQGKMMARHLAHASEYGVFSGNHGNLAGLLQLSITEEDVESIIITNKAGELLVQIPERTPQDLNSTPLLTSNNRIFRHPIVLQTSPADDINELEQSGVLVNGQEILGWVTTELSTARLEERQNQAILNAVYIILAGMMVSILLAIWISRGLTIPISRLTNSVRKIEDGELNINIDRTSSGEIGSLEKGVESMLGKIRITQNELQDKINETTSGLMGSLNLLEEQNQELSSARKEALLASKTKTRFLANMSHEIRTPMNGIIGFINILKKTNLTKEQNDYINTIDKSANNLLNLINDILDISKVESGKIQINNTSFNIEECVSEVMTLMTPAANDKGVEITCFHYSDTPNEIYAPRDRIRQILINYLGNAIKFTEDGTIVIRTMLSGNDGENDAIMISVTDTGIGIPKTDIDSVFSPFNQLDDTINKQHSGTGLGLAISRSLAKAMGGKTGVESEAGKGSKFWFSFMYKSDFSNDLHSANNSINNDDSETPSNAEHELGGTNILIAEDNEINTKLLKTILEHEGVNIFHAKNGKEAVELYKNSPIDLILMDIHMPVINGIDATKIIRDIEEYNNHIPIIGLTANAIEEDKIIVKSSGIDVLLLKPISIDDLLYEIKHLIREYKSIPHNLNNNNKMMGFINRANEKPGNDSNKLGVNHKLVLSLRKMLIDELPQIKQQLSTHFVSKSWGSLSEQIHRLLGGVAYCDLPKLRNSALSVQGSLKDESASLENDFKSLLLEINVLIKAVKS